MLNKSNIDQILLIILDGWGHNSKYHGNSIKQANTPTLDYLWHNYILQLELEELSINHW